MNAWSRAKEFVSTVLQYITRRAAYPADAGSVEERIASLRNFEEDESDPIRQAEDRNIRVKLQGALKRFVEKGGPDCVVLLLSALCLKLLERVLLKQARKFKLTEESLNSLREQKESGEENVPKNVLDKLEMMLEKKRGKKKGEDDGLPKTREQFILTLGRALNNPAELTKYQDQVLKCAERSAVPSENLFDCIELAGSNNKSDPLPHDLILPDDAKCFFHQIRVYSNKARHDPDFQLTVAHARIALDSFLSLIHWYYCAYKDNPLGTIYAEKPNRALLPSPPLWWVPPLLGAIVLLTVVALFGASRRGFLPTGPAWLVLAFGVMFVVIFWFGYSLFREDAYTGTGRWKQWGWLWGALFAFIFLLMGSFTAVFLGFPVDERRYIALNLRVGRVEAPETIKLTPSAYADFFRETAATSDELKGKEDWAKATSLTTWKYWMNRGLTDTPRKDRKVIVYQSDPVPGYYHPFSARFAFEGKRDAGGGTGKEDIRVKLLGTVAILRRVDPATREVVYQQLGFWVAENTGDVVGQVATKNTIEGIVLNQGDYLVIVTRLASLDGEELPGNVTPEAYAASLQRE